MNDIPEKIHLIERLASNPAATAKLLDKVIESLVENDRRKLAGFRVKLAEFKQRHGMSTAEFQVRPGNSATRLNGLTGTAMPHSPPAWSTSCKTPGCCVEDDLE